MSVTGEYAPAAPSAVGPVTGGETFSPFGEVLPEGGVPVATHESMPRCCINIHDGRR